MADSAALSSLYEEQTRIGFPENSEDNRVLFDARLQLHEAPRGGTAIHFSNIGAVSAYSVGRLIIGQKSLRTGVLLRL
jgi:hypothetical protein